MRKIIYCKRCLMPSSRPRISFDGEGVCNACRHAENKWNHVNWDARKEDLLTLLEKARSKDGRWDCVVPWSGGKDSSAIAYKLKFELGMNPLLVTFSPQVPNEVGMRNRESLIQQGFDHVFFRPDQKTHRHLAKRFFVERGNHKVAWDAGVNVVPVQVAVQYEIPLIFYAEHGESEYGGRVLSEEAQRSRDFTEVLEHQIGDDPRNWTDEETSLRSLQAYIYPAVEQVRRMNMKAYYFAHFFRWSSLENYEYIQGKFPFATCAEGRTEGTFTDFDSLDDKGDSLYYYMQYIKFGFGRALRDASRQIQNRQLTLPKALEYVHLYDHEFPARHLPEMLEYLQLTEKEFHEIIDRHRNPEVWKKENDKWILRFPPPLTVKDLESQSN